MKPIYTRVDAHALKAAIAKLVECEVADSWSGGGDPSDIPLIEEDLRIAREELEILIQTGIS